MQIKTLVTEYQTNTYFVFGQTTVVVDPGGSTDRILAILKNEGRQADYVLVTHGHYDHTFSCAALLQTGAKIFMPCADDYLVSGGGLAKVIGRQVQPFEYESVTDGQRLVLGDLEFEVMATPGHTPGSVCYILDKYIFSGDTLFCGTIGRTDFDGGDMRQMQQSLGRLLQIEGDYKVLPGHGTSTTLTGERVMLRRFAGKYAPCAD